MNNKKDALADFDDFGFTFADDVVEENANVKQDNENIKERMERMYAIFNKFLDNLSKNPENSTIVWPNRIEKIQEFKEILRKIKEGEQ